VYIKYGTSLLSSDHESVTAYWNHFYSTAVASIEATVEIIVRKLKILHVIMLA